MPRKYDLYTDVHLKSLAFPLGPGSFREFQRKADGVLEMILLELEKAPHPSR